MTSLEVRWRSLVTGEVRPFWGPLARLGLGGLAVAYSAVVTGHRLLFDSKVLRRTRLPCKVISVGNLTVGGTGKTTTVRWLTRELQQRGYRPAVLSYGYRVMRDAGPTAVRVIRDVDSVLRPTAESGDEAQLLSRSLPGVPVLIGKRRVLSGAQACRDYPIDVCILDDAFQYWRLERDLDVVLLDGTDPFGGGRVLPAGLLREPRSGLRRADAVIVTHADRVAPDVLDKLEHTVHGLAPNAILARARHAPGRLVECGSGRSIPLSAAQEGEWLFLSSLGSPQSFERTAREVGARAAVTRRFPDHHTYTREEWDSIVLEVRRLGLRGILTTEKDAVKLAAEWVGDVNCVSLEVDLQVMTGLPELLTLIEARLGHPEARS